MTNPVILLGTQSNGETLPVQVDATGRLVAEGLQGEKGDKGDQGDPGADGGSFPLQPDPYEGALLGWLNGELSWIGTPPIEVAPGVFGPITAWDPESAYLEIQGEIPSDVGTGVYVYQCEADGTYYTEGWNVAQQWSSFTTDSTSGTGYSPAAAFSGNTQDYWIPTLHRVETWDISDNPVDYSTLTIKVGANDGGAIFYVNDVNCTSLVTGVETYVSEAQLATLGVTSPLTSIWINKSGNGRGSFLYFVEADGKMLVDKSLSTNMRVQSVLPSGLIGLTNNSVGFTTGKYLYVPQQRVAPWVLYGNDPTSLIDHLRQTRD